MCLNTTNKPNTDGKVIALSDIMRLMTQFGLVPWVSWESQRSGVNRHGINVPHIGVLYYKACIMPYIKFMFFKIYLFV